MQATRKDGTDTGLELRYRTLPYRRKFLRTLWLLPLASLFLLVPEDRLFFGFLPRNVLIGTLVAGTLLQLAWNGLQHYRDKG